MNKTTLRVFMMNRSRTRAASGYTLIEIMLVLTIICVLLGAGIHFLAGNLDFAKSVRVKGDLETLTMQLHVYESQNMFLPSTEQGLNALVTMPASEPKPSHWSQLMKPEGLMDPWGHQYQYLNPGKHNTTGFDLYSLGPDGVESADDVGNWETTDSSTVH